jgi:N-acetylglucosamine kinase-like BadF-type ATPase
MLKWFRQTIKGLDPARLESARQEVRRTLAASQAASTADLVDRYGLAPAAITKIVSEEQARQLRMLAEKAFEGDGLDPAKLHQLARVLGMASDDTRRVIAAFAAEKMAKVIDRALDDGVVTPDELEAIELTSKRLGNAEIPRQQEVVEAIAFWRVLNEPLVPIEVDLKLRRG